MTTVGYGDYFPKSIPGRVMVFCVCIIGTILISLIVFLFTDFLEMTEAETKVMNIVIRMQKRKYLTEEAAYVVSCIAKLAIFNKKMKNENNKINKEKMNRKLKNIQENFKTHLETFRKCSRFSLFKVC